MAINLTYKNRKAAGLCTYCGAKLEDPTFMRCDICRKAAREARARKLKDKNKSRKGGLSISDVMKLAAENRCSYGEMVVKLRKEGIE